MRELASAIAPLGEAVAALKNELQALQGNLASYALDAEEPEAAADQDKRNEQLELMETMFLNEQPDPN